MHFVVEMARVQRERRVNLLAAETLGAAAHHGASILVASPNAGGPIEAAAEAEGIAYEVRAPDAHRRVGAKRGGWVGTVIWWWTPRA